jgi:hypothetical protein
MSMYPRDGRASPYTPSHMKPGMERGQLHRFELHFARSRTSTWHDHERIGGPNDQGTVHLLVSIPRERSME